ncbi:MAG TPA: (2Fe-2S)-binding protein, partial [Caulobacterales bacterium]|nr:(2Fe-2S)-binding protein [Caulobacterales bacterium]
CVLFIGPRQPPRDWLVQAFCAPVTDDVRKWLLFGRTPAAQADASAIVCACANVSANKIAAAIAAGARSIDALGAATRAGAACGSCKPELRRLLGASAGEIFNAS